jgi:capsule polysaccharide export protein KpsE/RkpR
MTAAYPPWLVLYLRLQAELNTLSSVTIEVPALRARAEALRKALG